MLAAPTTRRSRLPIPVARAPVPQACEHCFGAGIEPDVDGVPCLECDGCGASWVEFRLLETFSFARRYVAYNPGTRVLAVRLHAKFHSRAVTKGYRVTEIPTDSPNGRGFLLEKPGDGECHELHLGDEVSCSCGGTTYQSNHKACERAVQRNDRVYPSLGCVHLDSVASLLAAGWFDLHQQGCTDDSS